jgi:hypothetical protein
VCRPSRAVGKDLASTDARLVILPVFLPTTRSYFLHERCHDVYPSGHARLFRRLASGYHDSFGLLPKCFLFTAKTPPQLSPTSRPRLLFCTPFLHPATVPRGSYYDFIYWSFSTTVLCLDYLDSSGSSAEASFPAIFAQSLQFVLYFSFLQLSSATFNSLYSFFIYPSFTPPLSFRAVIIAVV